MIGTMTLSLLAEELQADLHGEDTSFSKVSTDTRSMARGDLFLALVGENFDGNKFVAQAEEKGACAAVVSTSGSSGASKFPILRVVDTHRALGKIANINRKRSKAKVIALTGSQGKTTVKEMLGAILNIRADCLITEANLNNTIGVPLTLLKISDEHDFVVVEMGADSAGEISFSANVTEPDLAVITNASATHIEGFGSLRGIVSAKGEIIEGLSDGGVLILNGDDEHVADWVKRAGSKRIIKFSYANETQGSGYYAADVEILAKGITRFKLHTPVGDRIISSKLLGKHNIVNAVAASAAAIEAGASLDDVALGLNGLLPVKGRLCPLPGIEGSILIDDSYNASPSSFKAAIDVLMSFPGRKILLAGEMKELGSETNFAHVSVGEYALNSGVDELWATGEDCKQMVNAFGDKGKYFTSKQEMIDAAKLAAAADLAFLLKGSRGARMDTVVNALIDDEEI